MSRCHMNRQNALHVQVLGVDRAGAMLGAFTAVTGSVILQLPPRT